MSVNLPPPLPPLAPVRPAPSVREIVTIFLLVGSVVLLLLPFGLLWAAAGWAVGAGMLWSSTAWESRDKMFGTLVWPGGLIGPVLLLSLPGQVCTQAMTGGSGLDAQAVGEPVCTGFALNPWVGLPLAIVLLATPVVVGSTLLSRLSRTET